MGRVQHSQHLIQPRGSELDANDGSADMAIGRVLRRCFTEDEMVTLDGIQITRTEVKDSHRNNVKAYEFLTVTP